MCLQSATKKPNFKVCEICNKSKKLVDFMCGGRVLKQPDGIYYREEGQRELIDSMCRGCLKNSWQGMARQRYKTISKRNAKMGAGTDFSESEFIAFLGQTEFPNLLKKYRRKASGRAKCDAANSRPSIDRIDHWRAYTLDNIQVVPFGENCTKGATAALGSVIRTMKFLRKVRELRGLNKSDMARLLGILPQTYAYYEDKAQGCSLEALCLIKQKLDFSWQELGEMIEGGFAVNSKDFTELRLLRKDRKKKVD